MADKQNERLKQEEEERKKNPEKAEEPFDLKKQLFGDMGLGGDLGPMEGGKK